MKGASKVIMGATLVMIVSIAILLGLVLILLAELYCSLLLRRRRKPRTTSTSSIPMSNAAAAAIAGASQQHGPEHSGTPATLSNFYAHGVINAPRNLLFPSVPHGSNAADVDLEKQHSRLFESCGSPPQETALNPSSSPSFVQLAPPKLVYEVPRDEVGGGEKETYIYICNPIYDNDTNRPCSGRVDSPFETPDSSPSCLETNGSSGSGEEDDHDVRSPESSPPSSPPQAMATPPLTPMKKLPAEAVSIALRDARSLPSTSGSESNSNNEGISSSLLSSGSPCTSPSW